MSMFAFEATALTQAAQQGHAAIVEALLARRDAESPETQKQWMSC